MERRFDQVNIENEGDYEPASLEETEYQRKIYEMNKQLRDQIRTGN